MKRVRHFFKSIFVSPLFFWWGGTTVLIFLLGFFFSVFLWIGQILLLLICAAAAVDLLLLYRIRKPIEINRLLAEKLSNGDDNDIQIAIQSNLPYPIQIEIIDEIPIQFQRRDILFFAQLPALGNKIIEYQLRPTERGVYQFGDIHTYIRTVIGIFLRKVTTPMSARVAVYPSFIQLKKFELLAISNHLQWMGIKKIRRLGHNQEFEQIREYVNGDEYRSVNWKATARRNRLMVNQYIDERSQAVYNVIDMGRIMKMPFNGLSLLDYAINASLILSNVALKKGDKAGLLTFSNTNHNFLQAVSKPSQMNKILETLYHQQTRFLESNFEAAYYQIKHQINQRSLILAYTNFETLEGLRRQLPYLKAIAKHHLLVVIFFENTELDAVLHKKATQTQEIYLKGIAEKFAFEKRQIVRELNALGIQAILTAPEHLTVNTINKYIEIKARGGI